MRPTFYSNVSTWVEFSNQRKQSGRTPNRAFSNQLLCVFLFVLYLPYYHITQILYYIIFIFTML